jgi:VWFA-related protein
MRGLAGAFRLLGSARLLAPFVLTSSTGVLATPQPQGPPFGERIEVRVVEVPVVVTDRQGRPVSGLARQDFVLRVNGEEIAIEAFQEAPAAPERLPAAEPLKLLVFFDDYFTPVRARGALIGRLAADVGALAPGDEVAVVRFAGVSLEVVSPWTSAAQAERAVGGILERPSGSQLRLSRLTPVFTSRATFFQALAEQIRSTTDAAAAALHGFDITGGRKVLVVASPGWPYEYRGIDSELRRASRLYGGARLLTPLSDAASFLGWTLYALESDLDNLTAGQGGAAAPNRGFPGDRGLLASLDFERRAVRWDSLSYLANATGGRVLARALVRRHPLLEVARDTGGRYLLAFTAHLSGDGTRHRLEVEVRRPGVSVRHRSEYRDLPPGELAALRTRAALLSAGAGGLRATLGKAQPAGRGTLAVPLRLEVPAGALPTLPSRSGHFELELRVLAVDERGDRSAMEPIPVTLEAAGPGEGGAEILVVETTLLLRPRRHKLAITLHDPQLGALLATQAEFAP